MSIYSPQTLLPPSTLPVTVTGIVLLAFVSAFVLLRSDSARMKFGAFAGFLLAVATAVALFFGGTERPPDLHAAFVVQSVDLEMFLDRLDKRIDQLPEEERRLVRESLDYLTTFYAYDSFLEAGFEEAENEEDVPNVDPDEMLMYFAIENGDQMTLQRFVDRMNDLKQRFPDGNPGLNATVP